MQLSRKDSTITSRVQRLVPDARGEDTTTTLPVVGGEVSIEVNHQPKLVSIM
jgi:hypothetical protein